MNDIKINSITPTDGLKVHHRKENGLDRVFIALDKKGDTIAELRTYWPGQTNVYACLWVHYAGVYASGSGVAGGYGYDKRSAAASVAFSAAGVDCTRFAGTGRERAAVEALGRKLAGKQFLTVVEAYG